MFLKNLLKLGLKSIGYDIVKYRKPRPVIEILKTQEEEEEEINKKRLLYYISEGKRFEWLKEYDFKTIIDIGANEGQFAGKVLSVFPDADIHCFEPLYDVFIQLGNNFNEYPNVFLYNYGLGKANEEKMIYRNEYSPSSSLLEMRELHKSNFNYAVDVVPEKISIRRLDDFFIKSINRPLLLKIDVQGYEKIVLEGSVSVVQQSDAIIIETSFYPLYIGQPLFGDIYKYLIDLDFEYAGNVEQLISPINNKILQADALFIRKNKRA